MSPYILTLQNYLKQTNSLVRFLVVGVINTLIGLSLIFILLSILDINYWVSTFIGNGLGATIGYFLNRKFTFSSNISLGKGAPAYIAVILFCYIGSYSISRWFVNWIGRPFPTHIINPQELAVVFGIIIYTGTNYLGQRYLVFNR